MDISRVIHSANDLFKGFFEVSHAQTPRYCFVIEKLEITYQQLLMRTKIHYTPVGCYRPFKKLVSELNDEIICRKFKPDHARIIIGIDTLEKNLDFNNQEQVQVYLNYVQSSSDLLKEPV